MHLGSGLPHVHSRQPYPDSLRNCYTRAIASFRIILRVSSRGETCRAFERVSARFVGNVLGDVTAVCNFARTTIFFFRHDESLLRVRET